MSAYVEVYWHSRKKLFSVRVGGRVVAHEAHLILKNVGFDVNQAGRARAHREGQKNVHAIITGQILKRLPTTPKYLLWKRISYSMSPNHPASFVDQQKKYVGASPYAVLRVEGSHPVVEAV